MWRSAAAGRSPASSRCHAALPSWWFGARAQPDLRQAACARTSGIGPDHDEWHDARIPSDHPGPGGRRIAEDREPARVRGSATRGPVPRVAVLAHTPPLFGPFLGWASALALEGRRFPELASRELDHATSHPPLPFSSELNTLSTRDSTRPWHHAESSSPASTSTTELRPPNGPSTKRRFSAATGDSRRAVRLATPRGARSLVTTFARPAGGDPLRRRAVHHALNGRQHARDRCLVANNEPRPSVPRTALAPPRAMPHSGHPTAPDPVRAGCADLCSTPACVRERPVRRCVREPCVLLNRGERARRPAGGRALECRGSGRFRFRTARPQRRAGARTR